MYITRLSISDLRSIEKAEIDFCHPGGQEPPDIPNVTLLLGDNGAGKTSVLRAIALAVLSPVIESSGFAPYSLVRRTRKRFEERAEVRAHLLLHPQDLEHARRKGTLETEVGTVIQRRQDLESVRPDQRDDDVWEGMFIENSAAFLMVGYSAGRRVEGATSFDSGLRAKNRRVRFQRVAGLFEEGVTLTPLGAWLPRYRSENPGRHKQVINLLNLLLPEGTRISDEMERDEYVFEHNQAKVPFAALSDGYRAYIGWIADLLYHICMGAPRGRKLVENHGIVLVDEIDLHLHPAWQREVVPQLARTLPNLQFVLTTHSPIVAGTLQAKNIRLIEPDETGASTIGQLDERIHGLNADQILVSSYFGLDTTRAPSAVDELRDLSHRARHGGQDAVREFLRRLAGSTGSWEVEDEVQGGSAKPAVAGSPGRGGGGTAGTHATAAAGGARTKGTGGRRNGGSAASGRAPGGSGGSTRSRESGGVGASKEGGSARGKRGGGSGGSGGSSDVARSGKSGSGSRSGGSRSGGSSGGSGRGKGGSSKGGGSGA